MKGLIPAADMGTRLKPYTNAIPKELLPIGGKAVIEHVIDAFREADITDITIVVGRKKNAILDYLGSGQHMDVNLIYVGQDERLGLANAIFDDKAGAQGSIQRYSRLSYRCRHAQRPT